MLIAQVVFSYQAYGYICLHSYVWAICPERASNGRPYKDCSLTEDYTLIKDCTLNKDYTLTKDCASTEDCALTKACASTKVCTLTKACTLSKDYASNKACTLNQSLYVDRRLCVIGRWREVRKIPSQPKDYILFARFLVKSEEWTDFIFLWGGRYFSKSRVLRVFVCSQK